MTSLLRATVSFLLGVLACALAAPSVVGLWAETEVLDTDRYVANVGPLADDPAIRSEVADRVSAALLGQVDTTGVPQVGRSLVQAAVRQQTGDFVRSQAFADLWEQTNRTVQRQAVDLLRTGESQGTTLRGGRLTLDLTEVVDAVRTQVLDDVPGLASLPDAGDVLPSVSVRLRLADARDLERLQGVVRFVDRWTYVSLAATAVLLVLSVVTARRRRWALGWLGLGVAVSMGAVLLSVRAAQTLVVGRLGPAAGDDSLESFYGALTAPLRHGAVGLAVVGLLVALAAALVSVVAGRRTAP